MLAVLLLFGLADCSFAQSVRDRPPPIAFEDWRHISDDGLAIRYDVRFPSPLPSGVPENDAVLLSVYLPKDRREPVPAVLLLHYWGATDHRVEVNTARELCRRGVAGLVLSIPYHVERTPKGVRSGERAIVPDPDHLVRTMHQAIADIRRAIDFAQTRPELRTDRFGITGTSLGAIVSALASALDERITDAAFVVGGIDIAHILWHSSRVVKERDQMRRMGLTESKLREALTTIEPGLYLRERRPPHTFVVGARFDTVIPPVDTQKLIAALDEPHVLWLDTGHYGGFFIQKRIQATVAEFFSRSFAGQPFRPPLSLNAPTVRLGLSMTPADEDFQIAVGLDILRSRSPADPFVAALASPSGLQLFVGKPIGRGLAAGFIAAPKGVNVGLYWSIVL